MEGEHSPCPFYEGPPDSVRKTLGSQPVPEVGWTNTSNYPSDDSTNGLCTVLEYVKTTHPHIFSVTALPSDDGL